MLRFVSFVQTLVYFVLKKMPREHEPQAQQKYDPAHFTQPETCPNVA